MNQALATGAAVPLVCWSIAALLLRSVPPARRGRHSAGRPRYARFHTNTLTTSGPADGALFWCPECTCHRIGEHLPGGALRCADNHTTAWGETDRAA